MAGSSMDGRRRRWVALDVEFAFDRLGSRLLEEFGYGGLAVWTTLLAAAKRSPNEGTFSYGSEADGWAQLGLPPSPDFTLSEFFQLTGRLHETRKRSRANVTTITLRRWDELQRTTRRRSADEQTSTSEDGNAEELSTATPTRPDRTETPTRPDRSTDGWKAAFNDAKADPTVQDPWTVADYRYDNNLDKYDRLGEHINCSRCKGKGRVLPPYSPGGNGALIDCPGDDSTEPLPGGTLRPDEVTR